MAIDIHTLPEPLKGALLCPRCQAPLDGGAVVGERDAIRPPMVDDLSVCAQCSSILVFIEHPEGLTYRLATMKDIEAASPELKRLIVQTVMFARHKIATDAQYKALTN